MSEHNGSRIPPWFVKIIISIAILGLAGGAASGLAWGVWVTKGIFKVEQMADDVRDIKQILLEKYPRRNGGKR